MVTGRLDAWLHSCRYPNFGPTGIRDFEHLITLKSKSQKLYEYIGSHILSILLVIGSYFRNHEAERFGLDEQGKNTSPSLPALILANSIAEYPCRNL
ncbi:MAG: hypothetical protein DRH21_02575 [Deltaproteobacteria bacterium]|nr:MAG: hypothetical protein DRH21_02575 [Deltaproteobacteria bacterium]